MDPQSPPPDISQNVPKVVIDANAEIVDNAVNEERERFAVQAMPAPKELVGPSPDVGAAGGSAGIRNVN